MKRVVHIITSLEGGGAQNMLYKLLKYADQEEYHQEVISLSGGGPIGEKIRAEGYKVHELSLTLRDGFNSLIKAVSICKEFDVVNTWLYHADFFGFLISKVILKKKLIWNIRHSNLDKDANKKLTLLIVKANAFLSKYVDRITYNSRKAYDSHLEVGYAGRSFEVIPNGFELERFHFMAEERDRLRNNLGIQNDEKVILTVGRWDIQKDYFTLLDSLSILKKKAKRFRMLMCGNRLDSSNHELVRLIKQKGLSDHICLLGERSDVPSLYSACDIYVSSSLGESFSNSIGEAMACEMHCVVTDVGDSKLIVGDSGISIRPQDPAALSDALKYLLDVVNGSKRNTLAREKVMRDYDIKKVVKMYENNYN